MKRFFLLLLSWSLVIAAYSDSTISVCTNVDGMWSEWKSGQIGLYGNYGKIVAFPSGSHPALFVWKFTIDNFYMPYSTSEWLDFEGTIEYYVSKEFPDARSQFLNWRQCGFFIAAPSSNSNSTRRKIISRAKIRIAPYKKHPKVYNIWFDGLGFGVDLQSTYFKD